MTKHRILVVESNERNQDLFTNIFRDHEPRLGCEFAPTVTMAQWAMETTPPDLIILSASGLGADAMALLLNIRGTARVKHIPVIYVAARENTAEKVQVLLAGADLYQTTSFNSGVFILEVERLLQRKGQRRPILGLPDAVHFSLSTVEAVGGVAAILLVAKLLDWLVH